MNGRLTNVPYVLVLAIVAGCNQKDTASDPVAVQFGFGGDPPYTQSFQPEKPGDGQYISADGAGLRITLPQGVTGAPVAVALRNGIQGDFKIGVKYELVEAEAGGADWGSGFQVLLRLVNAGQDAVFVARQARRDGSQSVVFQHMTTRDGKRVSKQSKVVAVNPAIAKGEFVLEREGSLLAVRYGDEARPDLRLLGTFEVGPEPIEALRLAANPERGRNPVDVRVLNFSLSAGQLAAGPAGGHRHSALLMVLIALLAVGVVLCLVRRWLTARVTPVHPPDAGKS